MNLYYAIPAEKVEEAKQYAPTEGLPNQRFGCVLNPAETKAIVQAEWVDVEAMDAIGTRLGALLPTGQAEASVYAFLESKEWTKA